MVGGDAKGGAVWPYGSTNSGINNTYYWIDPHRNICGVIMMQFLPFADKEAVGLLNDFQHAVYSSHT